MVVAEAVRNDREGSPLRRSLGVLAIDVVVPTAGFYALQAVGVGVVPALAISGAAAGVRVAWSALRERHLDGVALFVLVVTAIGIPLSFVVGSPQLMLAKEELGIPPMGAYLLVTGLLGRPAMVALFRPWLARTPAADAAFGRLLDEPGGPLTRLLCRAQIVYGLAFLLTSAVRLSLVFTLPVTVAVGVTGAVLPIGLVVSVLAATPFTGRADAVVRAAVREPGAGGAVPAG